MNKCINNRTVMTFLLLGCCFITMTLKVDASKQPFYNFRMSYRDDPQHSAVIGWSGSRHALIYFDTVSRKADYRQYRFKSKVSAYNHYKGQHNNFARLSDLTPGTRYYFVLRDTIGNIVSRELSFKTLPENAASLLIVAGGDSRNSIPIYEMSPKKCRNGFRNGNILVSKIVPDVVIFGGDFTLNKLFWNRHREWSRWLSDWQLTITPDGLLIPIIPAMGNHEDSLDLEMFFDMPSTNGVYHHLLGGDLASLNTFNDLKLVCNPAEIGAMDSMMKKNQATTRWQLVQYHIPMISQGTKYENREDLIRCWAPLFQKWGVDIVSESHAHILKTTFPIIVDTLNRGNIIRNDSLGTTYIGEGAWGAPLRKMKPAKEYIKNQQSTHGFHILQISRDRIQITAISFENAKSVKQNPSNRRTLQLPENLEIIQDSGLNH
jgi:hypothetical protein